MLPRSFTTTSVARFGNSPTRAYHQNVIADFPDPRVVQWYPSHSSAASLPHLRHATPVEPHQRLWYPNGEPLRYVSPLLAGGQRSPTPDGRSGGRWSRDSPTKTPSSAETMLREWRRQPSAESVRPERTSPGSRSRVDTPICYTSPKTQAPLASPPVTRHHSPHASSESASVPPAAAAPKALKARRVRPTLVEPPSSPRQARWNADPGVPDKLQPHERGGPRASPATSPSRQRREATEEIAGILRGILPAQDPSGPCISPAESSLRHGHGASQGGEFTAHRVPPPYEHGGPYPSPVKSPPPSGTMAAQFPQKLTPMYSSVQVLPTPTSIQRESGRSRPSPSSNPPNTSFSRGGVPSVSTKAPRPEPYALGKDDSPQSSAGATTSSATADVAGGTEGTPKSEASGSANPALRQRTFSLISAPRLVDSRMPRRSRAHKTVPPERSHALGSEVSDDDLDDFNLCTPPDTPIIKRPPSVPRIRIPEDY